MKKTRLKTLTIGLALLFLLGCATPSPAPVPYTLSPQKLEIVLEIEGANGECDIDEEWKDELSSFTFVSGGEAYMSIFSTLTVGDTKSLWSDVSVLESATDVRIINLFLNSPGGDAFNGLAMADHLKRAIRHGFTIQIHASGIVASAAVPIFAVGSKRFAAPGTIFMVHETSLFKWPGRETHSDIIAQSKLLNLIRNRYLKIMADHTKLSAEEWGEMEGATTWFDVHKAKEWGLLDKID